MRRIISKIISILNLDTQKEILLYRLGFRTKSYEQKAADIVRIYRKVLKPGMLVFDIGANLGHYAAAFLKLGTRVVCAEPQNNCFKILQARYKNNKSVHLLNCGLDSEIGEKKIHISNMSTISSMSENWISAVKNSQRFPEAEWSKEDTIKTTTLEALIGTYGIPDFVKIDVEGYELNVLKGLKSKVPLISIEYTAEIIETAIQCIRYLQTIGEISILLDNIEKFDEESKWVNANEATKFLEQLKGTQSTGDLFIKFVS